MAISSFYNTTAILETYTFASDGTGQEIKTWTVSTTIIGTRQGRSGSKSVVNTQEGISVSDRFYCNVKNVRAHERLVFSTTLFTYKGSATSTSSLSSTQSGDMYFCASSFSTYNKYDYAIMSSNSSDYIINDVDRMDILYVNDNLRNRHLQIDLGLDYENRT